MAQWPRDNQADLIKFYGDPGKGQVARQLVKVVPPFQMYYDGHRLKSLNFHKKAAPALKAALDEIWERSGRSQALLDKEGISNCAGTYNPRKVRGHKTKWSNHAFGAAIDLDAAANGLGMRGDMPDWVVAAFKRQGARWGGDYKGRKDPMHFEFCDAGPIRTASLGAIDLPEMDADIDMPDPGMDMTPPPHRDVAPDDPVQIEPRWYERARTWVSGGGFGMLGAGLYDWRVAVALGAVALVAFLVIWFTFLRKRLEMEL